MYQLSKLISFLFISLFLFSQCQNEIEDFTIDNGFNYYPTDSGAWRVYQVDSIVYNNFFENPKSTSSHEVREVFTEIFIDNEGREATKLMRYIRPKASAKDWSEIAPEVIYVVKDEKKVERINGALRFIKMIFPVIEDRTWQGNNYINTDTPTELWSDYYNRGVYSDWEYTYKQVAATRTIGRHNFDSTLTVLHIDKENLVDKVFSTEIYAKGVGLVYQEEWILRSFESTKTDNWPDRADKGHVVKMSILEYGVE